MIDIKLFLFGLGSKNLEAGSFAWALSIFRIYRNRRIFRDYFSQCSHFTKKKKKKKWKNYRSQSQDKKLGLLYYGFSFYHPDWYMTLNKSHQSMESQRRDRCHFQLWYFPLPGPLTLSFLVYWWGPPSFVQLIFQDRVVDPPELDLIRWSPEKQSPTPHYVSCVKLYSTLRKLWVVPSKASPWSIIERGRFSRPGPMASWNGIYYISASHLINSAAKKDPRISGENILLGY